MVDHHPSKHKELSDQLISWWRAQTDFKIKKELATYLSVHPDTLGEYFSGRNFPRSDIASRLYDLTKIPCLNPHSGAASLSEMVKQDSSSPVPVLLPPPIIATSLEDSPEPDFSNAPGLSEHKYSSGKSLEAKPGQPSSKVKNGERYGERSVVISFQRTTCPFCMKDVSGFCRCGYCGQSFVWANVPIGRNGLS